MRYRHVVVTGRGGSELLQLVQGEIAPPGGGQVRLKVLAAGVANADILMRRGRYPGTPKGPFTPGYDVVGIVEELGPSVSGWQVGEVATALTVRGGYAEQVVLPATELVRVPEGLESPEVACLTLNYLSAYQMLHRVAGVKSGQRILVHGAAGGVGTALLQLGRLAGLEMYGTASRAKHDVVERFGATPIDYRSEDFVQRIRAMAPGGVDGVFDAVGGSHFWRSFRLLRRGGRLVGYGFTATSPLGIGLSFASVGLMSLVPARGASFYSVTGVKKAHPDWFREDLTHLLNLLAQKKIAPVVAERLPLSEAARAQEMLERSAVSGKIVLLCQR